MSTEATNFENVDNTPAELPIGTRVARRHPTQGTLYGTVVGWTSDGLDICVKFDGGGTTVHPASFRSYWRVVEDPKPEPEPIMLRPGDPTPDGPHLDDDWFRLYGPDPGSLYGTTHVEVHELCSGPSCAYRPDERCPWHPLGCDCSFGGCQSDIRECPVCLTRCEIPQNKVTCEDCSPDDAPRVKAVVMFDGRRLYSRLFWDVARAVEWAKHEIDVLNDIEYMEGN